MLEIIKNIFWFPRSKVCSYHPNTPNIGAKRSNQLSLLINNPPILIWKLQRTISISQLSSYQPNTLNRGSKFSNWSSLLISNPPLLLLELQSNICIYHLWSDIYGRSTVGNHTRHVIFISELKITFISAKYIKHRRQLLESIVTSDQSYATPFLETSKDLIYITSGRICMVELLFEIIQDVLFWFLSSTLIIEAIDCLNIKQQYCTLIVHTKQYHHRFHFAWIGTRECYTLSAGKGWRNFW